MQGGSIIVIGGGGGGGCLMTCGTLTCKDLSSLLWQQYTERKGYLSNKTSWSNGYIVMEQLYCYICLQGFDSWSVSLFLNCLHNQVRDLVLTDLVKIWPRERGTGPQQPASGGS